MPDPKRYWVYIMANNQRFHVLYAGVTGNLPRRVWEHKNKIIPGFTCQYNLTRLVYYEAFSSPDNAIDREKEIKGWRRNKKIRLIEAINPHWYDLAAEWGDAYKPECGVTPRKVPRLAGENARHRDDRLER
jgi:putative endonuclease